MYHFERFTDAAKETLTGAQQEAERSHHGYIGTEHLLIALVTQRGTIAGETLAQIGVTEEHVRARVAAILGQNERIIIQQIVPTSPTKKVIEASFDVARRAGSETVATDHLLLGLLVEGEGIAAHVLVETGASEEVVRTAAANVREAGGITESRGTYGAHHGSVGSSSVFTRGYSAWMLRIMSGATAEVEADLEDEVTDAHVLRYVVQSQDPRVTRALQRLGVDLEALIASIRPPENVIELRWTLRATVQEKRAAAAREDYPAADAARLTEMELRRDLSAAEAVWMQSLEAP